MKNPFLSFERNYSITAKIALANLLVHVFWVGLAWHTIGIYHAAISTFLDPHHLHRASNHPVISKLMHHFYLQCPPSCKHFYPWDVESLLSLLESWAPASSLTIFKLAWKTATLLVLVIVKHCSDLTLLCNDNQHFFLQHHAAIFISMSDGKTDCPGHLLPQICIDSHTNVNLCPVFLFEGLFEMYWTILDKARWIACDFSFLGSNRQHRPVCTETISWVRKVLCVAKAHMSPGSVWGVVASAALVAGVSLVSILQRGDWAKVSTPAGYYFSPYITAMDWHQDSVQHALLGLNE